MLDLLAGPAGAFVISLALTLGVGVITRHAKSAHGVARPAFSALDVALAFCLAWAIAQKGFQFPPREAFHWTPVIAALAGLCGLVLTVLPGGARSAGVALAGAAIYGLAFRTKIGTSWPAGEFAAWIGVAAVLAALTAAAAARLERRAGGTPALLALGLASAGSAVLVTLTGSLKLGITGGTLAAVIGGLWFAGLALRRVELGVGAAACSTITLGAILLQASRFADTPPLAAAVAFLGVPAALIADLAGARLRSKFARAMLAATGALLPVAAAVLISLPAIRAQAES